MHRKFSKKLNKIDDESIEIIKMPVILKDEDVWRVMRAKERVIFQLQTEVSKAIKEVSNFSQPKAIYKKIRIEKMDSSGIYLIDGTKICNKFASHLFQEAEEAIFIAVTIGNQIDEKISQLINYGSNIEAVIMDYVGIAASFNAFAYSLNILHDYVKSQGKEMGTCLRPGDNNWALSGQETIFKVLPAERIGVQLLESSYMKPAKSQSGIIPIGTSLKIKNDDSEPCKSCISLKCPIRNVNNSTFSS